MANVTTPTLRFLGHLPDGGPRRFPPGRLPNLAPSALPRVPMTCASGQTRRLLRAGSQRQSLPCREVGGGPGTASSRQGSQLRGMRSRGSVDPAQGTQREKEWEEERGLRGDARGALEALDRQLAELAGGKTQRDEPQDGLRADAADSSPSSSIQPDRPNMLGRDANAEGWPEFDATFFTYSCAALLILSVFTNWAYYSFVFDKGAEKGSKTSIEKAERKAKIARLYQQFLEGDPAVRSAPSAEIRVN